MANNTLSDEINIMIDHRINQLPYNQLVTIIKIYDDENYVDAQLDSDEILKYIRVIGTPTIKQTGILTYLENNHNNPIIICGG